MIKQLYVVTAVMGPRKSPITHYAKFRSGPFRVEFSPNFDEDSVLNERWAVRALEQARESEVFRSPKMIRVELGTKVGPAIVNRMLAESLKREKNLSEEDLRILKRA